MAYAATGEYTMMMSLQYAHPTTTAVIRSWWRQLITAPAISCPRLTLISSAN